MIKKRIIFLFIAVILILFLSCIISLVFGSVNISIKEIFRTLINPSLRNTTQLIIWQIRIPRLLLGLLVGAGLSVCGATLQALLRNPLAEPYTLGISAGGALGVTLAVAFNLAGFYLPLFAFIGSIFTIILIFNIASRKKFSNPTLILAGVILSSLFSSTVLLLFSILKSDRMHHTLVWLMGDLSSLSQPLVKLTGLFVLVGIILLLFLSRDINVLTLGEHKAMHLGVDVELMKKIIFLITSLITGACVASAGIIGFVGLIIPHFVRQFFGVDYRILLPAAALAGAAFLVICDTLSRTLILPLELPVGVITGICGGIFFIILLVRVKKWEIF